MAEARKGGRYDLTGLYITVVGGVLFLLGGGGGGIYAAWVPALGKGHAIDPWVAGGCVVLCGLGTMILFIGATMLASIKPLNDGDAHRHSARYVFAVGCFMFLAGASGNVAVAGFVYNGTLQVDETGPPTDLEVAAIARTRGDSATPATEVVHVPPEVAADAGAAAETEVVEIEAAETEVVETEVVETEVVEESADGGVLAAGDTTVESPTATQPGATAQHEDAPAPISIAVEHCRRCGFYVLIACAMAFCGALFFVTNSVWRTRYATKKDTFDPGKFWAGMMLRLGEAMMFNLVFVLTLVSVTGNAENGLTFRWLPVVGLLTGMFVKSGERVVFGFAQRVFAAMTVFMPSPDDRPTREDEEDHGGSEEEEPQPNGSDAPEPPEPSPPAPPAPPGTDG